MASKGKEVTIDLPPFLRAYKDGTVDRLISSPFVPPSPETHPTAAVFSKDITISPHVSARLYLPKQALTTTNHHHLLPILVYYHGGGFCLESAFGALFHNFINSVVSHSQSLIAVSIEYRLAPENPLPSAYEDSWVALNWFSSHAKQETHPNNKDQWLIEFGDLGRIYIGGDSAGGNITHNMLIRAGKEKLKGDVKMVGAFLSHPHFWGSKAVGSESTENREESWLSRVWRVVYPEAPGGDDNPVVNPLAENAPTVAEQPVDKMMVVVAEKDVDMRGGGVAYVELVKRSGWGGEVELIDYEGKGHCFHLFNPDSKNSKDLIKRLASFIV